MKIIPHHNTNMLVQTPLCVSMGANLPMLSQLVVHCAQLTQHTVQVDPRIWPARSRLFSNFETSCNLRPSQAAATYKTYTMT